MSWKVRVFYDDLSAFYHLIYPDWDAAIERQGAALDAILRQRWDGSKEILDVSCGIGTQALGLAARGYSLTASDLSPAAVARAAREATARDLTVATSVADMRGASDHHAREFDIVISCDNSVPHLLTDHEILGAMRQMLRCTRPGGGCVISVRDYESEDLASRSLKVYGSREVGGTTYELYQVWSPHPPTYTLSFFVIEDDGSSGARLHAARADYYAIRIGRLVELMGEAGFARVERIDGAYFQPVIVGTRPEGESAGE